MRRILFPIFGLLVFIFATIIMVKTKNGESFMFIKNDKTLFYSIFVLGLIMCAFGITRTVPNVEWGSMFNIAAYICGAFATIVSIAAICEKNIFGINGYRTSSICIMIVCLIKIIIVFTHDFIKLKR